MTTKCFTLFNDYVYTFKSFLKKFHYFQHDVYQIYRIVPPDDEK
jgi:hypothetical protein